MTDTFSTKIVRYLPPAPVMLTFALVYVVAFVIANPLFNDPDAAWHIIAGDTIRATGGLPATNLWSWIMPNQKWYLISWLWDLMVSLIHSLGGPKAVFVSTQLLIALTMALIAWHMRERGGISSAVIVILTVLAGFCFQRFIMSRPQLAGYLFVAICHLRLHRSRDENNYHHLLWLPIIMVLWVNTHGSFLAAFALFASYIAEAAWRRQWGWLTRLCVIGALCALAIPIANPYGFDLYNAVMTSLHTVMNKHVEEWMPFTFGNNFGISLWLVLFILLSNFREPTAPLADRVLCALCLLPMLKSTRHASVFILVSIPYMAINLQCFVGYAKRWCGGLAKYAHWTETPALRLRIAGATAAVIVITVALPGLLRNDSYLISPWFDSRPAIAWARDNLAGKRLLNDYNFGGMMIYRSGGTFPVFVDGRAGTAYPEDFLADYEVFEQFYRDWAKVLDKYQVNAMLLMNSRPFVSLYANGARYDKWELVYSDQVASIFVRKDMPTAPAPAK